MNDGIIGIVIYPSFVYVSLKEFGVVGSDTYTWGLKDFHKCWSGSLAKRRLCLGPAGVINCTPLSALSFWVSLFPETRGYNRKTDTEAETPILWLPDVKNWLIWKDPDARKDLGQEGKGTTEDEMVGWHHWLDRHEFEQAPEVGDGQGSLVYCSPWGHKEPDTTELNWPTNNNERWWCRLCSFIPRSVYFGCGSNSNVYWLKLK